MLILFWDVAIVISTFTTELRTFDNPSILEWINIDDDCNPLRLPINVGIGECGFDL